MKYSALLVDDEKPAIETLSMTLHAYCPDIEPLYTAGSVAEAVKMIEKHEPQILFLDIRMPGADGFSLFEKTDLSATQVIFTTAYDQYAVRAFTVSACHYLLKPIGPNDLVEAVERAKAQINQPNEMDARLKFLQQHLKSSGHTYPEKMIVPVKNGYEIINVKEIVRVEGERNYARIHTSGGKNYLLSKTMRDLEDSLDPALFFRIHQSHLVNMNLIKGISSGLSTEITLTDGVKLPVSRNKKKGLMDALKAP